MLTSELIGKPLNYAVLKAQGQDFTEFNLKYMDAYPFSTDWSQGGPIIERRRIELHNATDGSKDWVAHANFQIYAFGPTPLIAAMRCFVASKLGYEVEIPKELQ